MRVGVAADHGGFRLKEELVAELRAAAHEVVDFGAISLNPDDDYPDFVIPLARAVAAAQVERGVAICGSGVGASGCDNKIPGVRAGLIHDHFSARQGVEDDHMKIICMGGPDSRTGRGLGPRPDLFGCRVQSGRTTSAPAGQGDLAGNSTRRVMSGFLRTSVQVRHALPFGVREKRADERIVVLRISPDVTMAIGATVMDSDDKSIGEQLELMASHRPGPTEMDAYERLLGDAMEGNKAFFAREDYVEEAWRIVDPVIKAGTPLYEYELGAQRSERACLAAGWLAQPDSFHAAMKIEVLEDGDAVAQRAAGMIAEAARAAAAACGRFV